MRRIQKILQWIVLSFFGSTIFFVILYRFVPVYITPLMVIRCAQQVGRGEQIRLKHHWIPLKDMSKYLPVAVMASEDQRFLQHHGFDVIEIQNAVEERMSGKRHRGGSTISQQTAKNVFLWPASSWVRKGFEAYFTVLIELFWSKERIMEVYLNSIETGDGIYGAEAVAQQHFRQAGCQTHPRQLRAYSCNTPESTEIQFALSVKIHAEKTDGHHETNEAHRSAGRAQISVNASSSPHAPRPATDASSCIGSMS